MKQKNQIDLIKQKLSYCWRDIYRYLSSNDLDNLGKAPLSQFEEALLFTKTFLSREELKVLQSLFGQEGNMVDYIQVSQQLMGKTQGSWQSSAYDKMRRTHQSINKIRSNIMSRENSECANSSGLVNNEF